ncbi:disease resistance protein Roq1-like [Cryptomeria japonica]|uniref:disease resistance protein Roq1-like n=1 Tax=Cryptomeria japonica TaxID=3369 RepID=UPI0027DA8745|nr:disease resistance protein Roq1-like [Cryptomeria japonica]
MSTLYTTQQMKVKYRCIIISTNTCAPDHFVYALESDIREAIDSSDIDILVPVYSKTFLQSNICMRNFSIGSGGMKLDTLKLTRDLFGNEYNVEQGMEIAVQYQPPATKIPFDTNNKFNVFLSFRGKDVRTTFVDHLYESLSGEGLKVFLDSEELEKGKEIDSNLQEAIKTSDVLIPIFSKHYAESTWCLKEAAQMWRSNGFIIPLFYDVEPSDVRYPQREGGPFAKAFQKHYSHLDQQDEKTIEEWKNVLQQISSLSGWTRAEEFGLYLSSWHSTVRVGVSGIGGVGKTTLAKAVYNRIYARFDAYFFAQKKSTLVDLQRAILRRLVNYHGEVSSVAEGKALMKNLLQGVRALVILDDVNDLSHLDALSGDWCGPGSRIIFTSRDRHILNLAKVDSILNMSGLGKDEALQLFCWHAFSRAFAETPYKKLSTRIARACKGHPLSLQVIGAYLFDKKERDDIQYWEEALHNIWGKSRNIQSPSNQL